MWKAADIFSGECGKSSSAVSTADTGALCALGCRCRKPPALSSAGLLPGPAAAPGQVCWVPAVRGGPGCPLPGASWPARDPAPLTLHFQSAGNTFPLKPTRAHIHRLIAYCIWFSIWREGVLLDTFFFPPQIKFSVKSHSYFFSVVSIATDNICFRFGNLKFWGKKLFFFSP